MTVDELIKELKSLKKKDRAKEVRFTQKKESPRNLYSINKIEITEHLGILLRME